MPQLTLFKDEKWVPVPGWEERYKVSDKGRVKSLSQGGIVTPQTLSESPNQKVRFRKNGHKVTRSLAKLVVEVFGDPPTGSWVVKHLDGDKTNNRIENLKPVSKSKLGKDRIGKGFPSNMDEWEEIPGWDGEYLAHRSGKIFSVRGATILSVQERSGSGYYVRLRKDGDRKRRNPGRLIIKTFQDPVLPDDEWGTYRINGEKDFRLCNLVPRPRGDCSHPNGRPANEKFYKQYQDRAERHGVRFMLSREDFDELCSSDCYYCGARPSYMKSVDGVVNGIDRLYPDVGYVKKNCVPCCSECNVGKATSTPSDFVERAIRIANRHSPNDIRIPRSSVDMSGYT